MHGWAPDDYCRAVRGYLAPKEKDFFGSLDLTAYSFDYMEADKAWKHGWEILDKKSGRWAFSVSLDGRVLHTWQHDEMGNIKDPDILTKMRDFLNTRVDENGQVKETN